MSNFTYLKSGMLLFLMVWCTSLLAQNVQWTGLVTGESGEPIPGSTILMKGTTTGVATDLHGRYSLSAPNDAVLVFSFIGSQTQDVEIGNRTVIDIVMISDFSSLEEVVVIGYGTARKRDLTGAVSSVRTDRLEN